MTQLNGRTSGCEPSSGLRRVELPAAGEGEQEVERGSRDRPGISAEVPVEVVGPPHHAVAEPVGGDGELERHEDLAVTPQAVLAVAEQDAVDDAGRRDLPQEVVHGQPLVVPLGESLGPHPDALAPPVRVARLHPVGGHVVEPKEGGVQLGDDQVLVVAGVAELCLHVLPREVPLRIAERRDVGARWDRPVVVLLRHGADGHLDVAVADASRPVQRVEV